MFWLMFNFVFVKHFLSAHLSSLPRTSGWQHNTVMKCLYPAFAALLSVSTAPLSTFWMKMRTWLQPVLTPEVHYLLLVYKRSAPFGSRHSANFQSTILLMQLTLQSNGSLLAELDQARLSFGVFADCCVNEQYPFPCILNMYFHYVFTRFQVDWTTIT